MAEPRPEKNAGFRRLYLATLASLAGFRYIARHEEAFRLELAATLVAPLSVIVISGSVSGAFVAFSACLLMLLVETLNTAIEVVVDRISLERHPLSGAAKDLGSLAVLISMINAFGWWIFAFFM